MQTGDDCQTRWFYIDIGDFQIGAIFLQTENQFEYIAAPGTCGSFPRARDSVDRDRIMEQNHRIRCCKSLDMDEVAQTEFK